MPSLAKRRAGMMTGDTIISIDGSPVSAIEGHVRLFDADRIGRTVPLDFPRNSQSRRLWIAPVERGAA